MIRRIQKSDTLGSQCSIEDVNCEDFNYSNVIVTKPWGYEFLAFENDLVAIWILHIVRKRRTSMHCHPKKKTALIVLVGNATCFNLESKEQLEALDSLIIESGAYHSTEASSELPIEPFSENGIWVMEIETPPDKTDLVRMEDPYGRVGKSYEGQNKMVFDPQYIFQMNIPKLGEIFKKIFHDCIITVINGVELREKPNYPPNTLISVIARQVGIESPNQYLQPGEVTSYEEFTDNVKSDDFSGYTFIMIEKGGFIKLSDYVFSFIADLGVKDVFLVSGGSAMHLVDSLGISDRLNYVATHHEQSATMSAEACARITGKPGVALVSSGPGGTNAITGVCGAWVDSIPCILISGQVTSNSLNQETGLRQFGVQESNILELVEPITKYAAQVTDSSRIRYHLEKAAHIAISGRPGPVWLDIPLDIQSKLINPEILEGFIPEQADEEKGNANLKVLVDEAFELIKQAKRPLLICGYGIRLAKATEEFGFLVDKLGIPVVSSWTSSDLIPSDHELYVGRIGIMGDRGGNFAVQNSDLLLIIGSRMSVPQIGYNFSAFAREAKKIMVDIDDSELKKSSLHLDVTVQADAKTFINELNTKLNTHGPLMDIGMWKEKCRNWKERYPVALSEYKEEKGAVNSFYFVDQLSSKLDESAVVVTDMGTSMISTMQTFKIKLGQRLFTSSGHSAMGFGLPGAIGACVGNGRKKTICISGEGGLQMNIQELQTLVHYKLPVILFVLNNQGYLTIKVMQQNHFGRFVGSEASSGVSSPDIIKLAEAYGIPCERIKNTKEFDDRIDTVLAKEGPYVCEIMMPENQPLIPKVSSLKKPDGTIISKPLEDLYPFLDRDEFEENMLVKPYEVLK